MSRCQGEYHRTFRRNPRAHPRHRLAAGQGPGSRGGHGQGGGRRGRSLPPADLLPLPEPGGPAPGHGPPSGPQQRFPARGRGDPRPEPGAGVRDAAARLVRLHGRDPAGGAGPGGRVHHRRRGRRRVAGPDDRAARGVPARPGADRGRGTAGTGLDRGNRRRLGLGAGAAGQLGRPGRHARLGSARVHRAHGRLAAGRARDRAGTITDISQIRSPDAYRDSGSSGRTATASCGSRVRSGPGPDRLRGRTGDGGSPRPGRAGRRRSPGTPPPGSGRG
jgi:hypothetical protein